MENYFITLFINNRYYQYKIGELIQNSSNGRINENFVSNNKNVYLPFLIQGDKYCLQNKSSQYRVKRENQEVNGCVEINHGDYFVFQSEDANYSVLVSEYSAFSIAEKVYVLGENNVFFGRSDDMDVVINLNNNVSRKCAAIRYEQGAHYLEDLSGKTGVYVNGRRENSKKLAAGDEIYIMGTTAVYYPDKLVLPASVKTTLKELSSCECLSPKPVKEDTPYVRTPRIIKSEDQGKIIIDPPPAPEQAKDVPFILAVGPSITMALAMLASLGVTIANVLNGGSKGALVTAAVMAASMLAGALLWPTLLRKYNKKQRIKNEIHRQKRYSAYLTEKEEEIKKKYDRNARVLNENLMPAPSALVSIIEEKNRRLWERTPKDDDFLKVRLGIGEVDFAVDIQAPPKGFSLEDDVMLDKAIALKKKYEKMQGVPIAISLTEKKVVGVVGQTTDVLKTIVTNLVALHSSDELKLVLIYNAMDVNELRWVNDLPHTWSNDKKQRYIATNKEEARTLLAGLDEMILVGDETVNAERNSPYYVVLVLDEHLLEDLPFRRHLINAENTLGISTVFFGKQFSGIPKECVAIIQKDVDVCGMYVKNENNNRFIRYVADEVDDELMKRASVGINKIPVKIEKTKASVPDRVNFLDMYRVGNVEALEILNHWRTNISEKSLAAPIGVKAGGEAFALDIHEKAHGCHGLVAGTTGSGKSEFLQAYILSMMINYSPNEVAFVLVDFKGGDMARPFLKSPHLAATISNLSGNTLHRALISLEAEVKNRQNIFNRSAEKLGVDKIDINSYHKFFKDKKLSLPLPHLIIVIDEFAQLKSQHPEFMSKLVDIAQVGRSLGIHLILATQRPSGVIDPQIWSNSKFKVCLKVLDKQDSMDMLRRPEAALIKQAGRAYVQVGYDEIFEQIQSGYSGADYVGQENYVDEESVSVNLVNWPAEKIRTAKKIFKDKKSNRTQLEEVVSVIASTGEEQRLQAKQLWLPPLPHSLLLEDCSGADVAFDKDSWDNAPFGEVVCGKVDLPEKQEQRSFGIDFLKNGHLAIYGSSGSGKSTLVQTILYAYSVKYSPEKFNVFVMDFDGNSLASVASMPHCVKYASDSDERAVEELLGTIQNVIAERNEKFAKNHCANYESYIAATNDTMPMIALVVDNYSAFRERMYRSEDVLVQIVSAARSCGIYLMVTGNSKGAIYYKMTEQISNKIVLNMNDSGAYRDILNVSVPLMPEHTKGRALTVMDNKAVEVQFAVPFDTANEAMRVSRMQAVYGQMRKNAKTVEYHFDASALPTMAEPTFVSVYEPKMETLERLQDEAESLIIGYDISTNEPKGASLSESQNIFIGTRGNEEVAPFIVNRFAFNTDKRVCVITEKGADKFDDGIELVTDVDGFVAELVALNEEERKDTVIVVDGFCDFYDRISDDALMVLERALKNGLNVTMLTFDAMQRISDYRDTGLYVYLVRTQSGAIVGGQIDDVLASSITTDIYEVSHKFREKQLEDTQAIVYCGKKIAYVNIDRS